MELEKLIKKQYDEFRPAVSEQEWELISQDSRLVHHNRMRRWRKVWIGGGAALLTAAAIVTVVMLTHPKNQNAPANTSQTKSEQVNDNIVKQAVPTVKDVKTEDIKIYEVSDVAVETDNSLKNTPSAVTPVVANNSATSVSSALTSTPDSKVSVQPAVAITKKPTPAQHVQTPTPIPTPKATENVFTNENTPEPDDNPQVEYKLFVPSAFTPNGDGLNDQFLVSSNFDPLSFDITIFTKASEKVFHSRSIDIGWDGTKYGAALPQGVYLYLIKYTNPDGKVESQKGQILLLK